MEFMLPLSFCRFLLRLLVLLSSCCPYTFHLILESSTAPPNRTDFSAPLKAFSFDTAGKFPFIFQLSSISGARSILKKPPSKCNIYRLKTRNDSWRLCLFTMHNLSSLIGVVPKLVSATLPRQPIICNKLTFSDHLRWWKLDTGLSCASTVEVNCKLSRYESYGRVKMFH